MWVNDLYFAHIFLYICRNINIKNKEDDTGTNKQQ